MLTLGPEADFIDIVKNKLMSVKDRHISSNRKHVKKIFSLVSDDPNCFSLADSGTVSEFV